MASVSISSNLTDTSCVRTARELQQKWQSELTRLGSTGDFTIGHGDDGKCSHVEGEPFNGNLWIWTSPRNCDVFLSKQGNHIDYAGAGRDIEGAYRGTGGCQCGRGH